MITRYSREEISNIWTQQSKFTYYLKVELAVVEAYHKMGLIEKEALEHIKKTAKFDLNRINAILIVVIKEITMAKKTTILLPKTQKILTTLGENIRLARLRRNVTAKLEAERAGISIATLAKIESGCPNVAIGSYMQVLATLRLGEDMLNVGKDDELGRKIQDAGLTVRRRASKKNKNEQ
jgi:hypothetical protein